MSKAQAGRRSQSDRYSAEEDQLYALGEEYILREDEFDAIGSTERLYAPRSNELLNMIETKWQSYCHYTRRDPTIELQQFHIRVIYSFFHWLLETRQGRIRSASSLQTYWNSLCLVRRRRTGLQILEPSVKDSMIAVRQRLARKFNLKVERRAKPVVNVDDQLQLFKTLWGSSHLAFPHERFRVQLALIAQLAGITGNRPSAILGLRYGDLKLSLLRDRGLSGTARLLVDVTFRSTKGYRGPKAPNTFPIPEVPCEPCLALCPHVVLLSLMFTDNAFEEPIDTPQDLYTLRVPSNSYELRLPIRKSVENVPIFRVIVQSTRGCDISETDGMEYSWLNRMFKKWGDITGLELPLTSYAFRRANGAALDSSAFISDAQRNVMMQHATSRVFESNYLSHYISKDSQAAYRGLNPQTELITFASGTTRSLNAQQPRELGGAQQAQIERRPEIRLIRRTLQRLKRRIRAKHRTIKLAEGTHMAERYSNLRKELARHRIAFGRELLQEQRAGFREQFALQEIEQQLKRRSTARRDDSAEDSSDTDGVRAEEQLSEERHAALEALFARANSDIAEDRIRRIFAVHTSRIFQDCGEESKQ
ncbi:hypothetical protein BAUCODRAFT_130449 [Baudoinia panamericana UAMH 10762]|uniref:C2H2 finger domain protein n=1 Tax=Baudoinia panamericana (strain UAMH 10762) TaxID=717646 RepID=M2MKL2_BAUPA|nr:uncharacterized protein BAUCODRAFT_130449 [Baudoinia panamericana UAMH 10762]EMC97231.1 hypothetical protein BAUCODRAFT_130449 [Baudoinia panamericana UAMH 10762]